MGENIDRMDAEVGLKKFTQHLLRDLKALEMMLDQGMIESGIHRIGAEQELCLVDRQMNAAPLAMEILERIEDPHVVNEFARFNLEINADPQEFEGKCFSNLQQQLEELIELVRGEANHFDAELALVGILPTLRQRDLVFENMTPLPRYEMLDEQLRKLRGEHFTFSINGTDELIIRHPSALLESCNTSFQTHLQVSPHEFADKYNFAQLISAPLLAAACNSSLFFGKRLWKETRIALFQQSIDTRNNQHSLRQQSPRVTFGSGWIKNSVTELFQDDLSRYRLLIHSAIEENALEVLEAGGIPRLRALCLFNGTVYRWNRACYGVGNGKPHLRIECRIFPSGPTIVDEVANCAFWSGLMHGMPDKYRELHRKMPFDLAQFNFFKAAKMGLDTQLMWLDDQVVSVRDLILDELLPIAREGLANAGVDEEESQYYLNIIEDRIQMRHTGSLWMFESFNKLLEQGTRYESAVALTAAMVRHQKEGLPIHKWPLATRTEADPWLKRYLRIEQIMTTDLYTVSERDLVDLAAHIMEWKRIRHVPVEDEQGHLVGMVTARSLMRRYASDASIEESKLTAVTEIMVRDPISISPETLTLDALDLMQQHKVSCLPVVTGGKLVGVVTESDFTRITSELLRRLCADTEAFEKKHE